MDDRILLVPAAWAPDPEAFQRWASPKILLTILEGFLPVDLFRWPHLKGEKPVGTGWDPPVDAFDAQVLPVHHVVDIAGTGTRAFLASRGAEIARSLTTVSFSEALQALEAHGEANVANFMRLQYELSAAGPAQILPLVMQGADEVTLDRAIREASDSVDRTSPVRPYQVGPPPIETEPAVVPSLFLQPPPPLVIDGLYEVFRRYAPEARRDSLQVYGLRIHEEDGGRELANKVIPFIQEVIAARGG